MQEQHACDRHGGTFETSPYPKCGEVSLVRRSPQNVGKAPLAKNGTSHAINNDNLGVAADLPLRAGRGGSRNRADRQSHALTAAQVGNQWSAMRHASIIDLPFTRMVTIHWQAAGIPLNRMASATGRFTDLLSKTLARHGSRTAWAWVHEGGERKGGHCHLLAHVPADLVPVVARLQRGWLRRITGQPYRSGVILSKPIGGRLGLEWSNPELHAANLAVAFGYICKGAPQAVLDRFGVDRLYQPGGLVIGKRCGTSQNISAKAREGGDSISTPSARTPAAESHFNANTVFTAKGRGN